LGVGAGVRILTFSACGCVAGGGPYAGYGSRGWIAGAEAGAGLELAQLDLGLVRAEDPRAAPPFYARLDATTVPFPMDTDHNLYRWDPATARVGGGVGFGSGTRPVFVLGAGVEDVAHSSCGDAVVRVDHLDEVYSIKLQLRFSGTDAWLVVAPRFDLRSEHVCSH